jgi:hypothetical protein
MVYFALYAGAALIVFGFGIHHILSVIDDYGRDMFNRGVVYGRSQKDVSVETEGEQA